MNRARAIREYCFECSGDSPKEVTLCNIFDCPLWQYRFGYSMRDKRFKRRMEAAKKNYKKDYQDMLNVLSDYISDMSNSPEIAQILAFFEKSSRDK